LQPTERAHQLAPRLRVALAEIRSVVATPIFDPAKTSQRFITISARPLFLRADRSQPDRRSRADLRPASPCRLSTSALTLLRHSTSSRSISR